MQVYIVIDRTERDYYTLVSGVFSEHDQAKQYIDTKRRGKSYFDIEAVEVDAEWIAFLARKRKQAERQARKAASK